MRLITESVSYFHVCEEQTGISWTGLFTVDLKWVWQDGLSPLVPHIPNKKIKCSFYVCTQGIPSHCCFCIHNSTLFKMVWLVNCEPSGPFGSYDVRDVEETINSMTLNFENITSVLFSSVLLTGSSGCRSLPLDNRKWNFKYNQTPNIHIRSSVHCFSP